MRGGSGGTGPRAGDGLDKPWSHVGQNRVHEFNRMTAHTTTSAVAKKLPNLLMFLLV
jgi:hypothetical protein